MFRIFSPLHSTALKAQPHKLREMEEAMSNESLVNYDPESNVLYIVTTEGRKERSAEIAPGINIELEEEGRAIGIEILNTSEFLKPVARVYMSTCKWFRYPGQNLLTLVLMSAYLSFCAKRRIIWPKWKLDRELYAII